LVTLTLEKYDFVWPALIQQLKTVGGIPKTRLLNVISSVNQKKPSLVQQNWHKLWAIGENSHLQHQLFILHLLQESFKTTNLPQELEYKISDLKRRYSSVISASTYRLLLSQPSIEFVDIVRRGALYDFRRQLDGIAEVLDLGPEDILADLERRLVSSGWKIEEAKEKLKEEWHEYTHPQGWPVVWFFPSFDRMISALLYSTVGEYFEKMKFKDEQLEAVWRIIQPSDPEWFLHGTQNKPTDISPLAVVDKAIWFKELSKVDTISTQALPSDGWTTLFEHRVLSQDTNYEVPYKSNHILFSTLINPQKAVGEAQILDQASWKEPLVAYSDEECMTWGQARDHLLTRGGRKDHISQSSIPIIAVKHNPIAFSGFEYIVSLPSFIIDTFKLSFKGPDLYMGSEQITCIRYWQEGYIDEAYSRDLLSFGTRFQIRAKFLRTLLQNYGFHLCRKLTEERNFFKSIYHKEPDESAKQSWLELFL